MNFQPRMLSASAGLLLLGGGMSSVLAASGDELDSRLLGSWRCQLQPSETSTDALASWTEKLSGGGVLEGRGATSALVEKEVIQFFFNGRGSWSTEGGVFRAKLETVDLAMEGNPAVIDRLNKDQIKSGFLLPSTETYELTGGRWVRRKNNSFNVTVCRREG